MFSFEIYSSIRLSRYIKQMIHAVNTIIHPPLTFGFNLEAEPLQDGRRRYQCPRENEKPNPFSEREGQGAYLLKPVSLSPGFLILLHYRCG
jgi:hypothetical protein